MTLNPKSLISVLCIRLRTRRRSMRGHVLQVLSTLCVSAVLAVTVQAQPNLPHVPSAQTAQENDHMVEGVVVSMTPDTLVIRSDDNQYHLFTYHDNAPSDIKVNDRV